SVNQPNLQFNIGEQANGLGLQASGTVSLTGSAIASLRVGLNLDPNPTIPLDQRFYIRTGADTKASLNLRVISNNLSANITLGLLTVSLPASPASTAKVAGRTSGLIDPNKDASLSVSLADPSGGTQITLSELTNPANLLTILGLPAIDGAVEVVLHPRVTGINPPAGT